jgi:hypothetical protein
MNRKLVCFIVIPVFFVVFTACSTQAGNQTSFVPSPTATNSETNTPLPTSCQPDRAQLDKLESQLPYDQKVILYQAFSGEHTLVVWFVEPELGTAYTAENETKAVNKAVEASRILVQSSLCGEDFDLFHITVVGVDYTQWFSGPIRPGDLPLLGESGIGGSPDEERGAGISAVTAEPPVLPEPNACAWQTVSPALDADFNNLGFEAEFYYVRDSNGNNVFVNWVLHETEEPLESIPLLARVVEQISCLYPEPTGVSLTVAGEDGVMLLTGYLPVTQSGEGIKLSLDDFSYHLLGQ